MVLENISRSISARNLEYSDQISNPSPASGFKPFNDAILDDKRILRAFRGFGRDLNRKAWNFGTQGDFETMCESVRLLLSLYEASTRADKSLRESVAFVSDFCLQLSPRSNWASVLKYPVNISFLDGTFNVCAVVGYSAVCYIKKVSLYDLNMSLFGRDELGLAQYLTAPTYKFFDRLENVCYTDNTVAQIERMTERCDND